MALTLVTLVGATPGPSRERVGELSPEIRRYYDSLLALPDSLLQAPGAPPAMSGPWLRRFARRLLYAPESLYAGPDSVHRTDAEMRASLVTHEREFDWLVRMFRQDSSLQRAVPSEWRTPNAPEALTAARRREYDRLLTSLGVRMMLREANGLILLRTTTVWTFDRKGYAWAPKPPRPIVDRETTQGGGEWVVYRHLKGPWYIYFQPSS